jgi:phosphatidylserine decarboxylase
MFLHKEGTFTIGFTFLFLAITNLLFMTYAPSWALLFLLASLVLFALVVQFFRNPKRAIAAMDNTIVYAPADGKIVVIEETEENEYFKERRLQVSVFMNPLNVHVNRNGIGGEVKYYQYHEGKYLVAWHPKASTENERTTTVISNGKSEVMFRQIAGALARRITNYTKVGQTVTQGEDMGFIKFGSRVDIFLPLDAKIECNIGDISWGNKTIIARLS